MPVSLAEAMQTPQSEAPTPKPRVPVSLDVAMGKPPEQSKPVDTRPQANGFLSKMLDTAKNTPAPNILRSGGQAWIDEIGKEWRSAWAGMKDNAKAIGMNEGKGPADVGHGLNNLAGLILNAGQIAAAPMWAPIQLGVVDPGVSLIDKIPDSTMDKIFGKGPPGGNAAAKEGMQNIYSWLVNFATIGMGAKAPKTPEAGGITERPAELDSQPPSETPAPITPKLKVKLKPQKPADEKAAQSAGIQQEAQAQKMETAFNTFATQDPSSAHRVAEMIEELDPKLGAALKDRVAEKANATPEEQVEQGRASAGGEQELTIAGTGVPTVKPSELTDKIQQQIQQSAKDYPATHEAGGYYIFDSKNGKVYGPHSENSAVILTQKWNEEYGETHWVVTPEGVKGKESLGPPGLEQIPWEDSIPEKTPLFGASTKAPEPIAVQANKIESLPKFQQEQVSMKVSEFLKQSSKDAIKKVMKEQDVLKNKNFRRWFKDSKVVDEQGEPELWYHVAPEEGEKFTYLRPGYQGNAIFLTNKEHFASTWKPAGHIFPVYVRAEKPWNFKNKGDVDALMRRIQDLPEDLKDSLAEEGVDSSNIHLRRSLSDGSWSVIENPTIQTLIRDMGHDGYYVRENGADNLAVLDSNQVKSAIGNTGEFSRTDPRLHAQQAAPLQTGLWGNLQQRMEGLFAELKNLGKAAPGKAIINSLIKQLPKESLSSRAKFQNALLHRLKESVGQIPVKIVGKLDRKNPQTGKRESVYGFYYNDHSIDVVHNASETQSLIHELTHAATVKFMEEYPNHPLTKEMNRLHELAKARWEKEQAAGSTEQMPYGLTDPFEFVAEAFTSRGFQQWLMSSERFATPGEMLRNIWNKFAELVQRMLGLDKYDATLMHNVLDVGESIMERRAEQLRSTSKQMQENGLREGARGLNSANEGGHGPFPAPDPRKQNVAIGQLTQWYRDVIRTFNPEALGRNAEIAASEVARKTAEVAQKDAVFGGKNSARRRSFWSKLGSKATWDFIKTHEQGGSFKDPVLQKMSDGYRDWGTDIYMQDMRTGFKYEPIDHYMMHAFEPKPGDTLEAFLQRKFGSKWQNPAFIKARAFEMYEEAVKAGFKPKYDNPEDIMLARQHASDVAEMQTSILSDLADFGAAIKKGDQPPPEGFGTVRRSPTGELYYVHHDAASILHNAFDTQSLWNANNLGGSIFRAGMDLKNKLVPIRLFSLFHVAHIGLALDNATGFAQGARLLLSGRTLGDRGLGLAKLFRSVIPLADPFFFNPKYGSRIMKAYRGDIKPGDLRASDLQALQYMSEGGFVPYMDKHWRASSIKNFQKALADRKVSAIFHAPFAAIQAIMHPMMERWIPSLKVAAYLKEVGTQLKLTPELVQDPLKRQMMLRKLAQHVDDRYGEMNYSNLFWPKWIKDLFVLNTLSLGWQKGLISQFGGAPFEVLRGMTKNPMKAMRQAELNKALWVTGYSTMAMGLNGLMSYALSGDPPEGADYLMPKDGEGGRLSTPFWTREFYAIYKKAQSEGAGHAMAETVQSKGSGILGLAIEAATGAVSIQGHRVEIRDPDSPPMQQLQDTLHAMMKDVEPISAQQNTGTTKSDILAFSGFAKAPKYATDSRATAQIKSDYRRYHAPGTTSFEKAQYGEAAGQVRDLIRNGDPEAGNALSALREKYGLSGQSLKNLMRSTARGETTDQWMFGQLTESEQRKALDAATPEEREVLLRKAKKLVRATYRAPEDR